LGFRVWGRNYRVKGIQIPSLCNSCSRILGNPHSVHYADLVYWCRISWKVLASESAGSIHICKTGSGGTIIGVFQAKPDGEFLLPDGKTSLRFCVTSQTSH